MAHLTPPPPSPSAAPLPPSAARPDRGRGGSPVAGPVFPAAGVSPPETLSPGNPPRIVDSASQSGDFVSSVSLLADNKIGRIPPQAPAPRPQPPTYPIPYSPSPIPRSLPSPRSLP